MVVENVMSPSGLVAIGAGIAFGLSALATGLSQKDALPAAIGAVAEDPKLFTKVLIFAVLPETALIFGFVIVMVLKGLANV